MTAEEVFHAIHGGGFDEHIDDLAGALRDRRRALAARTVARLSPGASVRLRPGVSPGYLVGRRAEFVARNARTVTVKLPDEPAARRLRGKDLRVPNELVEPEETA